MTRLGIKILPALALVAVFSLCSTITLSWSQEKYPSRPIEMVVAFPAGGFADVTGRIFSEEMSKVLNTPIAPINKGGATGSLAATTMLNAPKDGYSILVNTLGGMVLAPVTLKDVTYDTIKDFYPVAFITSAPDGLTVRAESPYKTLNDLIDAAKKNPNKLSYGTAGTGVGGHFNSLILSQDRKSRSNTSHTKAAENTFRHCWAGTLILSLAPRSRLCPRKAQASSELWCSWAVTR